MTSSTRSGVIDRAQPTLRDDGPAAGIPAREVSGFIYGEAVEASFGGHAWCEVEVDGYWHSVDPSWGETMINATHIRISSDRPSTGEMDLYMGGLEFRILSIRGRNGEVRQLEPRRGRGEKRVTGSRW